MRLLIAAGLVDVAALEKGIRKSRPAQDRLLVEATRFLLAGGTLSLSEFDALTEIERQALAQAGEELAVAAALRAGTAAQGPDGVAAVAAPIDGGAAQERLGLRRALDRVTSRAGRDRPVTGAPS